MKKLLFSFVLLFSTVAMFSKERGTVTASTNPIDPTQDVTITYDGKGTNFANWQPLCHVYLWLKDANNQDISTYKMDWVSCNGDADYAKLDDKVKMTYVSSGVYKITVNIQKFFNVPDVDLAKIAKLGVIVRAQYDGDNNQTEDMFLDVKYEGGSVVDPTPDPEYEDITLYFVNDDSWANVSAYVWYGTSSFYKDWPGEVAVKTGKQANGKDVYSYTFSNQYVNIIFNNGLASGALQTDNLTYDVAKPYYSQGNRQWYATLEEIPDPVPAKYYITGSSNLVGGNGWTGADIKVTEDSYTFKDLPAGAYEFKLTIDGTWSTEKGFYDLTEVTPGLYVAGEYGGNIGFELKETSDVTITYNATTFTVKGNFYVDLVPAKFYITGDEALVGAALAWNAAAIKVEEDSYTFTNLPAGDYKLKVTEDGSWGDTPDHSKGFGNLTTVSEGLTADGDGNICFTLTEAGDVTVTYISGKTFTVTGNFYVEPVVTTTLTFVPNIWNTDGAQFAAWVWGDNMASEWVSFFGQIGDTLTAEVNVKATNVVFARFDNEVKTPEWTEENTHLWNQTGDETINTETYTFTITAYGEDGAISVGQWTPYIVYPVEYYIAGSMTDWAENMVLMNAGEDNTYTLDLALEAETLYEFKVVRVQGTDTVWYGVSATEETWEPMVYGNSTGWWLNANDAMNIGLQTTTAATYIFTFVANENNEISVTIPEPEEVEKEYYVMGDFVAWGWGEDASVEMTPMTEVMEGMYSFVVEEFVASTDRQYEYKVREGKDWNGYQYPEYDNLIHIFEEAGTYKLEFSLMPEWDFFLMTPTKISGPVTSLETTGAALDKNAPIYNILGQQVDAMYKGVVIQNGAKHILK